MFVATLLLCKVTCFLAELSGFRREKTKSCNCNAVQFFQTDRRQAFPPGPQRGQHVLPRVRTRDARHLLGGQHLHAVGDPRGTRLCGGAQPNVGKLGLERGITQVKIYTYLISVYSHTTPVFDLMPII